MLGMSNLHSTRALKNRVRDAEQAVETKFEVLDRQREKLAEDRVDLTPDQREGFRNAWEACRSLSSVGANSRHYREERNLIASLIHTVGAPPRIRADAPWSLHLLRVETRALAQAVDELCERQLALQTHYNRLCEAALATVRLRRGDMHSWRDACDRAGITPTAADREALDDLRTAGSVITSFDPNSHTLENERDLERARQSVERYATSENLLDRPNAPEEVRGLFASLKALAVALHEYNRLEAAREAQ